MGYLVHTLLHFLVGASIVFLFVNTEYDSRLKRNLLILFGGIASVSPDITKFFGDILGHSILLVPVFGLLFAIVYIAIQKGLSLMKAWLMFSIAVFSHLFIDYIGNGIALLYPLLQEEFEFSIVNSNDAIILYTLLICVIVAMFYRKGKLVVLTSLLIVSMYLVGLTISKAQLEQALKRQYQSDNINLLLTYPSHDFQWVFMVRTDKASVSGYSPLLGVDISIERENKTVD